MLLPMQWKRFPIRVTICGSKIRKHDGRILSPAVIIKRKDLYYEKKRERRGIQKECEHHD